jgi:hypothetical protein
MAKKKQITTDSLIAFIDNEISTSTTYNNKIQGEREKALKYYNRNPYGNEKKGRSTYVSSEVQETISWALPQIMKIFSSADVIKFDASKPQYQDSAQLATAYANNVINKQNAGFLILHNFFHDALLQKNGFLKVFYDKSDIYEREEYTDLSDAELTMLLQDENVEPIAHDSVQILDPVTNQVIQATHDITIKRKVNSVGGKIIIENVPVEEVIVSKNTRSLNLDDAPFVAHKVKRSISWLREQGYKIADDIQDGTDTSVDYSLEKMQRELQDGVYNSSLYDTTPADPSMRLVWVTEAYFKVDFNGDGIAETRKITKIGSTILDNEEVYTQPFISTSPFPQPHKFNGVAMADLVTDLQLLKSMLMRAMLDSFAFNINPSKAVDINKVVDVNDLLDTNPGNFIRLRGDIGQAITTLPSSGVGGEAFNLLAYVDDIAESRSGVSKMTQGIDKNVFNKTATGTQAIMSASQEKLAMIVRVFAETGLVPLYQKIIELSSEYSDGPEMINLASDFVEVNPKEWKHLKNISVNVGTGSLDKAETIQNLNALLGMQQQLMASGQLELMAMVDPMKIFNASSDLIKTMGYQDSSFYLNKPFDDTYNQVAQYLQQKQAAAQQPPIDPNASIAEAQRLKDQQELLIKTAEFELDKLKADREFELKKYDMQLKYELELMKMTNVVDETEVISQLDELDSLDPSNELLPMSQINTMSRNMQNAGQDPASMSLLAQRMFEKEQSKQRTNDELERKKQEQDSLMEMLSDLHKKVNTPKRVVRDANGKIIGITPDQFGGL